MNSLDDMLGSQIIARGVGAVDVIEAMRQVPREYFVPAHYRREAYSDQPLPIGHGQTISQPYIVALMTQALALSPLLRVLEIGSGSGYQTAILSKLSRHVYSIERLAPLVDLARQNLAKLGITNVDIREGDGTLGWPEQAPFDRILISAAGPAVPRKLLLAQLADGGVAILPCGGPYEQVLLKVIRREQTLHEYFLCDCRFVKLIGQEGWQCD